MPLLHLPQAVSEIGYTISAAPRWSSPDFPPPSPLPRRRRRRRPRLVGLPLSASSTDARDEVSHPLCTVQPSPLHRRPLYAPARLHLHRNRRGAHTIARLKYRIATAEHPRVLPVPSTPKEQRAEAFHPQPRQKQPATAIFLPADSMAPAAGL